MKLLVRMEFHRNLKMKIKIKQPVQSTDYSMHVCSKFSLFWFCHEEHTKKKNPLYMCIIAVKWSTANGSIGAQHCVAQIVFTLSQFRCNSHLDRLRLVHYPNFNIVSNENANKNDVRARTLQNWKTEYQWNAAEYSQNFHRRKFVWRFFWRSHWMRK